MTYSNGLAATTPPIADAPAKKHPAPGRVLSAALEMLDNYGMPTSKAKLDKLTSTGEIPHREYSNKLVFSREELLNWMEEQMVIVHKIAGRF